MGINICYFSSYLKIDSNHLWFWRSKCLSNTFWPYEPYFCSMEPPRPPRSLLLKSSIKSKIPDHGPQFTRVESVTPWVLKSELISRLPLHSQGRGLDKFPKGIYNWYRRESIPEVGVLRPLIVFLYGEVE
jgi:hypothetical protein